MKELLGYDDITLIPQHSDLHGRDDCDISVNILGDKYDMPLCIAPMVTITTPEMIYTCYNHNIMITLHRYFKNAQEQYDYIYLGLGEIFYRDEEDRSKFDYRSNRVVDYSLFDDKINLIIKKLYFSVGGIKKYKDWINYLVNKNIKRFCVDMAHGDIDECINTCKYIKNICEDAKIIAGNYATYSGIQNNSYADIYRVGISCGACCTTARNTGFGMPTYSSLLTCKNRNEREIVMADGGIKVNGDIAKAMSADADIVMVGYLLAGTSCASGEFYHYNDLKSSDTSGRTVLYKRYTGMASTMAKDLIGLKGSIEGISGFVKYEGNTNDVLNRIKDNLKSSLAYCGARNWKEFQTKVISMKISNNAYLEGKSRLL